MNILVLCGTDYIDGFTISDKRSGAAKLFNSPDNFGINDNSIVKVDGFNYITGSNLNEYDFAYVSSSNAYKWVTGIGNDGKIAKPCGRTVP